MGKRWLFIALIIVGFQLTAHAGGSDEMFTVYLVRHAEKVAGAENPSDPPLSDCGKGRAAALAAMLQSVKLERVYSSPYDRSLSTARPVADSHGIEVETYDPAELQAFADQLLRRKQNALVVGHSNTTAVLAGLLSGEAGEEFGEDEYGRLYLVTLLGDQSQVILLEQTFHCGK